MFDGVCPILLPLTLSSNSSYVLASCAACAARAPLRLSLSLSPRVLRYVRSLPTDILATRIHSLSFYLDFPLTLSDSTCTLPQSVSRAPRVCRLYFSLSLSLLSVSLFARVSSLSSFFSFTTSLDLPVRVFLDRRALHASVLHQLLHVNGFFICMHLCRLQMEQITHR